MKDQERIFWDTTKHPVEYPDKIRKIYFRVSLQSRKHFTIWVGNISKNFANDIDWWVASPLSRHPYLSNLFHSICILRTLEILSNQIKDVLVKVNSKSLFDIIKIWSDKNKLSINVDYVRKNRKIGEVFIISKCIFFYFFLFFSIRNLTKKITLNKNFNNNVLIDTYAIKESIQNECFYKGLDRFLKKKKLNYVFFVPTFVSQKNVFNIIKIIKALNQRNYLFKEHYLKFTDILFACTYFLRTKKYIKKYKFYKNWDLSKIICEEIISSNNYSSQVSAILNYKFAKNLSENKIPIKKTIKWFENHIVDKGWNLGFRKYFNKTKTYGYQGFLSVPHHMHLNPAKHEEYAKVIPSEIITVGKAYVKLKKEFFSKLKVLVGPALNYQHIYKINLIKNKKIKILIILTGIKAYDLKLLEWVQKVSKIDNIKITIKPHPILPMNKIITNKNFPKNYIVSNENLSSLLEKTKIAVSSGPTGATIECLAYNCILLIPVIDAMDEFNLKNLDIAQGKYNLIYNEVELVKKIRKIIKKKYILKNDRKGNFKFINSLFEKVTNKNLKYYY